MPLVIFHFTNKYIKDVASNKLEWHSHCFYQRNQKVFLKCIFHVEDNVYVSLVQHKKMLTYQHVSQVAI
jgi:hypothetical protein